MPGPYPAAAATAPAATAAPAAASDPAEIKRLIGALQDDKAREQLIAQLNALVAVNEAPVRKSGFGARLMHDLSQRVDEIGANFIQLGEQISRPDILLTWLQRQVESPDRRAFWARVFAALAGVLAAAVLVDLAVLHLLAATHRKIGERPYPRLVARLGAALVRVLLDLAPIIAFAVAGYGALALIQPMRSVRLVAIAVLNAAIVVRVLIAAARFLLAPLATHLRLLPCSDDTAAYVFIWARRFIIVVVYGYFVGQLSLLVHLSAAGHAALMKVIGLLATIMIVVLVLQIRPRVTELTRGGQAGRRGLARLRGRLAEVWHILAIVAVFGVYFVWALAIRGGFTFLLRGLLGTVAVIGIARLLVVLEHRLLRQLFSISLDLRQRYPTLEERASRYVPIVRGLLTGIIVAAAVVFVLQVWGVNALHGLRTAAGQVVLLGALRILIVVALALAVIEGAGLAIARYLNAPDEVGRIRARSARARTLLPLTRNAIVLVVGSIATISVLSQLGLDVAPLIAGVGIFGLALGFGAQSLVKDVITGAFILFEDSISIGDVVDVGGHSGTVEALSLRSVRMRDVSGHVHTVPFGAIATVTNRTRDFAYALVDVGVGYREDSDAVVRLLGEIGAGLQADPAFADAILAPLDILGVQSLGDYKVGIRVRFKTLPADQWRVARELNRRIKKTFDEQNVELAFPSQTLYFGRAKNDDAPPGSLVIERPASGEAAGARLPTDAAPSDGTPDATPGAEGADPAPMKSGEGT